MDFVSVLESAEDADGLLDGRLVDDDLLKASLQRLVLADILAILVQGGRADAAQLTTGKHGLEQIAGIHGAARLTGSDDGMNLVDEEDDASVAFADLLQDCFEALLELAAVLCARDERAHVQGHHAPPLERLGDISADDPLRKPFRDGRLSDAGLAEEDGVVLRASTEDLDDSADFLVAPNDWIQLARGRIFRQVPTVLGQRLVGRLRVLGVHLVDPANVLDTRAQLVLGDAVPLQLLPREAAVVREERQQQMLVAHVGIAVLPPQAERGLQHLL
mmetsp:Transcript_15893/g.60538  ORF Transcript_15893/g.60538 Transcript_15893/m.60538 type:complete len:275 (-) Transcript_15893:505-1329(-)